MQRVTGIGCVFFKSKDPEGQYASYEKHLGIRCDPVNYHGADIDALLETPREEGIEIDPEREGYDYGRFAWIFDPDGKKIERWEPPKK